MREIKFRAFYPHTKEMVDWHSLQADWDVDIHTLLSGHYDYFKVMQFTGLTDKNGVEIFEGDIVAASFWDDEQKIYSETARVEFEEGSFILKLPNDEWSYFNGTQDIEVIGNIHQHSELLEESK